MPIGNHPLKVFVGHTYKPVEGKGSKAYTLSKTQTAELIRQTTENGLDFIVLPVDAIDSEFAAFCIREFQKGNDDFPLVARDWVQMQLQQGDYCLRPVTGCDTVLSGDAWNNFVVFSFSPWIVADGCEASPSFIHYCSNALRQQLAWASHCGSYSVILPTPTVLKVAEHYVCPNFSRIVAQSLTDFLQTRVWVRIPLFLRVRARERDTPVSHVETVEGWSVWHHLARLVDKPQFLGVALVLTDIPLEKVDILDRWIAEPLRAVILPWFLFQTRPSGAIVLPQHFKNFLLKLFLFDVKFIIEQPNGTMEYLHPYHFLNHAPSPSMDTRGCFHVNQLLDAIKRIHALLPPLTFSEEFEQPCWDQLQSPLQPLRDNLESQTYETFERDPVKYKQYEEAIRLCLEDRVAAHFDRHTLMVAGAGRGPLVDSALGALGDLNIMPTHYTLIALEKNQNALITLRHRVTHDPNPLWSRVLVVDGDMRTHTPQEKVDILISELLGSFGDNELSPECLDGAQRFLSEHGVSIPSSYSSMLEPIMSPKLWYLAKVFPLGPMKGLNTSHVVKIHQAYYISREGAQTCFSFQHPNRHKQRDNSHNCRYTQLSFTCNLDAMCHGFAGYFQCTLYKNVTLSTSPSTGTKDMISWFPLYFPVRDPFFVKKDDLLQVHFWRLCNAHQVWYEWCVTAPVTSVLHNVKGEFQCMEL